MAERACGNFEPQLWRKTTCTHCFLPRSKHGGGSPKSSPTLQAKTLAGRTSPSLKLKSLAVSPSRISRQNSASAPADDVDDAADVKLKAKENDIKDLKELLNTMEKTLLEKTEKLENSMRIRKVKEAEETRLAKKAKDSEEKVVALQHTVTSLEARLSEATGLNDALQESTKKTGEPADSTVQLAQLNVKLSRAMQENEKLQEALAAASSTTKPEKAPGAMQKEIAIKQASLAKLEKKVQSNDRMMKLLFEKKEEAEKSASKFDLGMREQTKINEELREEIQGLKEQVQSLEDENGLLEDGLSVKVLNNSSSETKGLIEGLEQRLKQKEEEVTKLEKSLSGSTQLLKVLEEENTLLDDALQVKTTRAAGDDQLKRMLKDVEEQLEQLTVENASLVKENKELQARAKRPSAISGLRPPRASRSPAKKRRASLFALCVVDGCSNPRMGLGRDKCGVHAGSAISKPAVSSLASVSSRAPVEKQSSSSSIATPARKSRPKGRNSVNTRAKTPSPSRAAPTEEEEAPSPKKKKKPTKKKGSSKAKASEITSTKMVDYVDDDDLQNLEDPKGTLQTCLTNLDNGNWRDEFAAIDDMRVLITFHKDLVTPLLSDIVRKLTGNLNNLRSSIVKNALLCFRAMFYHLGKAMDKYMDKLGPVVLKRAADTNKFIQAEGVSTMESLVAHTTTKRSIKFLIPLTYDKAKGIRTQAAEWITACILASSKELVDSSGGSVLQDLVLALSTLLYSATTECRRLAKESTYRLGQIANEAGGKSLAEFKQLTQRKVDSKYRDRWDAALAAPPKKVVSKKSRK